MLTSSNYFGVPSAQRGHTSHYTLTRTVATADGETIKPIVVSCMHGAFWIATAGGNGTADCESRYRLHRRHS